jgi:ATP-dependent DNA ligase
MVPKLVRQPPEGDEWLHEIKYDGYRTQIVLDGAGARAFTRRGFDWSDRYRGLLAAASELRCSSVALDGEAIVQDQHGRSDFNQFAEAMASRPNDLVFMAFDLLHLNGKDMRQLPLIERRAALVELVAATIPPAVSSTLSMLRKGSHCSKPPIAWAWRASSANERRAATAAVPAPLG